MTIELKLTLLFLVLLSMTLLSECAYQPSEPAAWEAGVFVNTAARQQ